MCSKAQGPEGESNGFTETREEEERSREPFFTGVEQLIDEVFLDSDIAGQHVRQELIGERRLRMELPHHLGLFRARLASS